MDFSPVWLSLKLAAVTTLLLLVVTLPVAGWLSTVRFRGKILLDVLFALPIVLPPSVLGFYLLVAFSPDNWVGGFLDQQLGLRLAFSFPGLVVASMIYSFPFMVYPLRAGFQNLPAQWTEAAQTLGRNRWETLFLVLLPNIRPQILVAIAMTFAHTVGEFGVIMMIGGSIPGETRVASIAIWEELETLNYGAAHGYSLALFGISFGILVLLFGINRKWMEGGWR